jgi:hypothetical protein
MLSGVLSLDSDLLRLLHERAASVVLNHFEGVRRLQRYD